MEYRITIEYFQSISNAKNGFRMKIRSICNILVFRHLFIKGTDEQEWMPESSRIVLKPILIDSSCQKWFIGWKFHKFATFSIFGLFFSKRADYQEWMRKRSRLIQKPSLIDFHPKIALQGKIRSIYNIFNFRTLFHQWSQWSRMDDKTKSDPSETISNRFLIPNLIYRGKSDRFAKFPKFGLFFINGTYHQEWRKNSSRIILKSFSIDFSRQNWFIRGNSINLQ